MIPSRLTGYCCNVLVLLSLLQLQGQVHKLSAKGKTMETQYEEMEKMKASLEKALEAQRAKHEELQQQLSFSASEHESSSRPVSAGYVCCFLPP